jgi:large-conductance mechanosensitive channel
MALKQYWRIITTAVIVVIGIIFKSFVNGLSGPALGAIAVNQMNGGDAAAAAVQAAMSTTELYSIIITLIVAAVLVVIWAKPVKHFLENLN